MESETFRLVVEAVREGRLRISAHALQEAEEDELTLAGIEAATCAGDCIEDYPDDPRGSSCLVLGPHPQAGAVHALWGFDAPTRHAILITVYVPDPGRWSEDLRERRLRDDGDT